MTNDQDDPEFQDQPRWECPNGHSVPNGRTCDQCAANERPPTHPDEARWRPS